MYQALCWGHSRNQIGNNSCFDGACTLVRESEDKEVRIYICQMVTSGNRERGRRIRGGGCDRARGTCSFIWHGLRVSQ